MNLLLEMLFYNFLATCLFFYAHIITLKVNLKKLVIYDKYYPKHYIQPKRWMKKFLKIKARDIPKYIFYECYFVFIYLFLGFFSGIIVIVTGEFGALRYCMIIQAVLTILQRVFDLVYGCILKMD